MKSKKNGSAVTAHHFNIAQSDILSQNELKKILTILQDKRHELLQKTKQRIKSGGIAISTTEMADEVDLSSVTTEHNLQFQLLDRDRSLVAEIDHAIEKIQTGDYGYCEGTGEAIPKKRLLLSPWTRYSVIYQERLERERKHQNVFS